MSRLFRVGLGTAMACAALASHACDDNARFRGEAGESCLSRDDCEQGLRCVEQVCVEADDTAADKAGNKASDKKDAGTGAERDAASASDPLGREGDPCTAARECERGFACISNVCTIDTTPDSTRLGGRGESCRAKNDCAPELACVGGVCIDATIPLSRTPKQCHRIECEADDDCCAGFEPDANCDAFEENCKMDPIFCNTFRSLCECNRKCEENTCVAAPPGCSDDLECSSTQTPFCVDGTCAQCAGDANCPGDGARCIEGACTAACEQDEQCALLQACVDGRCEDVGCQSHRECVFLLGVVGAECLDSMCVVPCHSDIECASSNMPRSFQICEEGLCVFVGCETDTECRAFLGISDTNQAVRAVCK